ncbi:MAG: hypothetical protein QNJ40_02275 [Xanthomonadales bacterium]|nr:hypothetical protein [Xanthomonadales bacterium]
MKHRIVLTTAFSAALVSLLGISPVARADGLTDAVTLLSRTVATAQDSLRRKADRRRPGKPPPERAAEPEIDPARIQPVAAGNVGDYYVPVPDRWRIMETLGQPQRWFDPYNINTWKADKPLYDDWFLNVLAISDTVIEPRSIPTPVGLQSSTEPGSIDIFGSDDQLIFAENMIFGVVYYKGNTVFRPPDYEYRLTLAFQYNRVEVDERRFLNIDPRFDEDTREDFHMGVQELFFDKHLRNVSTRYDFDSFRIGIQPFSTDFRGFLFQDLNFGARLFGNRDNNVYQYNLAWFRRLEKDTNSGLNDIGAGFRDDDVFIANLYKQDWPRLGFFTQATIVHNRNREDEFFFDENGFIARPASLGNEKPRGYDVTYLGLNGDGHFGRLNLTASAYYAIGDVNPATYVDQETDIRAGFLAAEAGYDFDWIRLRLSALHASGDDDPFDDESNGFDAIFENPIFAGADTSYWIRQTMPVVGGGIVALSGRNAILPSMRSSKELGQSNFDNPGLYLLGVGADLDLTPETRLSFNVNGMWFDDTTTLEVARNQGPIDDEIGIDISAALIWRPFMSQNIVVRLSAAGMIPGQGLKDLYGDDDYYSVLANIILNY